MLSIYLQSLPAISAGGVWTVPLTMQDDNHNKYAKLPEGQGLGDSVVSNPAQSQVPSAEASKPPFKRDELRVEPRLLPADFVPGHYDVICARGKDAWNHSGNLYFRELAKKSADAYAKASTKLERTVIVSNIADHIYSKGAGFVRKDRCGKDTWRELGIVFAREKAGQILRNSLSSKYRSSHASKRQRRSPATRLESLQNVLFSNIGIKESVAKIKEISTAGNLSDKDLLDRFTQAQGGMLQSIKNEDGLVSQFNEAEMAATPPPSTAEPGTAAGPDGARKGDATMEEI